MDRFAADEEAVEFKSRSKEEFSNLNKKSGRSGVVTSSEVQNLNQASQLSDNRQGSGRMVYKDKTGQMRNLSSQVRNIQGRAVYQKNNEWIDLYVQENKNQKAQRIQFASAGYFDLLNKHPETSEFLSLGQNVRFMYKNNLYEIYE